MVWFKLDDGFYSSRKVLSIPRAQRAAAVGLWTLAASWSAKELSDGVVPAYVLAELGATPKLKQALVTARLWLDHPAGGVVFHDWAGYQPTREEVETDRATARERQRRHREKKRDEQVTNDDVTRDSHVSHSAPTRPDPTRPTEEPNGSSTSEVADATPRPEIGYLLDILDAEIQANGGRAPSRSKKNIDAVRLMLDRDGHTVEQIEKAIRWCQADEFWRSNILSASKLREKYEQLRLAATRTKAPAHVSKDDRARSVIEAAQRLQREHDQKAIGA